MENKNKKRIKFAMIVAIVGSISLLVGISYAIFNTVLESSKDQVIKVGSIALKFTEENGGIELLNLEELTDEEGISSDNYYTFSIENIGSNDAYYEIQLIDDPTQTSTLSANYVRANVEVDGVSKPAVNIETSGRVIYQDTITAGTTKNYKLRIWLNFGSLTTEEKQALLNQEAYFKIKIIAEQIIDNNLDKSGANKPELATNMIPVYYDETTEVWKKANSNNSDETNKWYDYDNKMWANAVTVSETNRETYLNAEVGTEISMNDINTMWVWIPRFSATGDTANYNGGTIDNPGAFDITFVDNKTTAHDAFTFGTQSLNGIWVGKFENSATSISNTTDNTIHIPIIKPDVKSWIWSNLSTLYYSILNMKDTNNIYGFDTSIDTTLDTHMMKNNEWGAIAYFTQSIYGRCTSSTTCVNVYINNSCDDTTKYSYTGRSGGAVPGSTSATEIYGNSVTSDTTLYNSYGYYTYDGYLLEYGTDNKTTTKDITTLASTTGNIYGIYDMSGGVNEYVMGVYTDGTQNWSGGNSRYNSGFTGCLDTSCSSTYSGNAYPSSTKYYNSYTTSTDYTNAGLQHANLETANWYGSSAGDFVDGINPWYKRGGHCFDGSAAGIFEIGRHVGGGFNQYFSSRSIIIK